MMIAPSVASTRVLPVTVDALHASESESAHSPCSWFEGLEGPCPEGPRRLLVISMPEQLLAVPSIACRVDQERGSGERCQLEQGLCLAPQRRAHRKR